MYDSFVEQLKVIIMQDVGDIKNWATIMNK